LEELHNEAQQIALKKSGKYKSREFPLKIGGVFSSFQIFFRRRIMSQMLKCSDEFAVVTEALYIYG